MKRPLERAIDSDLAQALKREIEKDRFPGVTFKDAMEFLLSGGILPRSRLPARSFLALEDWARAHAETAPRIYTATELKNKTGEIIDEVLRGRTIRIAKHGRIIAEIRAATD